MNNNPFILCVTGSDGTGHSGIQADIKTVLALGGVPLTAVTSVTVQNSNGIKSINEMPPEVIVGQVKAVYDDVHPKAVKIGLLTAPEAMRRVRDEVVGCPNVVCAPGILASQGGIMLPNESLAALCCHLIPISRLLILKCVDAEIILGMEITSDDDMRDAATRLLRMGAQWVLLRGGTHSEGRINALLMGGAADAPTVRFFSSVNVEGWQKHGVGGALSAAVATRLALGDTMPQAIDNAHAYIHSQVVYSVDTDHAGIRPSELYNTLLSLIADNYRTAHDVTFYAGRMAITPRYLSQVTKAVAAKSPKQIIDEYLLQEVDVLLSTTSLTIQEIAQRLGFSSQILLARFYKQKKGFPPTAFRNRTVQ